MKRRESWPSTSWLLLGCLLALAIILRILVIRYGEISFHYDMARDAVAAEQIWKDHHLKILGPPTSNPNLYHGVLYYYLIAPMYGLGRGNPIYPSIFLAIINALGIIPIFFLAQRIFKDLKWAFISGLFYAVAFGVVQYAPWLSNPSPAIFTTACFFFFLYKWYKGDKRSLYLTCLFAGLSTQFQLFLVYLFALIVIAKILFNIKVAIEDIVISILVSLASLVLFIFSVLKFHQITNVISGFVDIAGYGSSRGSQGFSDLVISYMDKFVNLYSDIFSPLNLFLAGLLAIAAVYSSKKNVFLLFCLFSNLLIFLFGGHSSSYAEVGIILPAILSVTQLLKNLSIKYQSVGFLLIILIFFGNLDQIYNSAKYGQTTLVIPQGMLLSQEYKLIDMTYKLAHGNPFSISTLTLPLWINTTWSYLYHYYGYSKYGYVPLFYGRDQTGLPGGEFLKSTDKPLPISFFILEPQNGIPQSYYLSESQLEDSKTKLQDKINFGSLILELRSPINEY